MSNLIIRPSLFSNLTDLHNSIEKLFRADLLNDQPLEKITGWMPKLDLKEEETRYVIDVDLPGVNASNIEISLENDNLIIQGTKESEVKEEDKNYVRLERMSGTFYRSLFLPNAGDAADIQAKSKNGVLTIVVPKNKKPTKQTIKVQEE